MDSSLQPRNWPLKTFSLDHLANREQKRKVSITPSQSVLSA